MTFHRRPAAGFWITVAVVAVLVYVASFGPWCYAKGRWGDTWAISTVHVAFVPVEFGMEKGPDWLTEPYARYLIWCLTSGKRDKNN